VQLKRKNNPNPSGIGRGRPRSGPVIYPAKAYFPVNIFPADPLPGPPKSES